METAVLIVAIGIAVLCGFLLLFWIISAFRGKRSTVSRMAAAIVGMSCAVWQVYVLNPAAGINLTYFMAPIIFATVLLVLFRAVKESTDKPSFEGPDVKTPAMAMRQLVETGQEVESVEGKKIAVGE
jgi:uncharacterized membrane protein YuzA (DUF378 family)